MDVLKRIAELRDARGWSNYKLAKASNYSQGALNNLFRLNNLPTIATLEQLCKGLGISMSQFFAEGDEPVALSGDQRDMLAVWDTLGAEQKNKLLEFIKTI